MRLFQSCARQLASGQRWPIRRLNQRSQTRPKFAQFTKYRHHSTSSDLSFQGRGVTPSRLDSKAHPLGWQTIQAQVEPYFGQHWRFPSEKAKQGFFAVGFSQAFSRFFPLTLNERVEGTCKMHYLALLIDGELDKDGILLYWAYADDV
jgi:aristolochene synthase